MPDEVLYSKKVYVRKKNGATEVLNSIAPGWGMEIICLCTVFAFMRFSVCAQF